MQYIKQCADFYYGLTIANLKKLAFEYAVSLQVPYPKVWDVNKAAGKTWYSRFMKRHAEFSLRTPQHSSMHRAKAFCKENVNRFFNQLGKILEFGFDPTRIYNMDETGFPTVPTRVNKIVAKKKTKNGLEKLLVLKGEQMSLWHWL